MIDLAATLLGGQCFGWKETDEGFVSVLDGRVVRISDETDIHRQRLERYFDLDGPYEEAGAYLASLSPVLAEAYARAKGLRILRQDPWVASISFILSQNNNIKRIRGLYEALCRTYGTHVEGPWFAFPTRTQLSRATEEELRALHFGYRARYVVAQCREFRPIPDSLPTDRARAVLQGMTGIGPKVADCILLYGYHRPDVFPMDTWMRKVMKRYFPGKTPDWFAPYQALAQQYLFEAARKGYLPC